MTSLQFVKPPIIFKWMRDVHLKLTLTKSLRAKKQNHKQAYLVYLLKLKNKKNKQVIMRLKQTEVQIIHLKRSLFLIIKPRRWINEETLTRTHTPVEATLLHSTDEQFVQPAACWELFMFGEQTEALSLNISWIHFHRSSSLPTTRGRTHRWVIAKDVS